MVILIVGESKIGKMLSEKLNKAGHRVIRAADAKETGEVLEREEKLDLFIAAPDFFAEREDLQADLKAGIQDGPDWRGAEKLYASCVVEPLQALQEAVLVMERGGLKRICFLNPVRGSPG